MNPYLHLVVWFFLILSAPVIAIYAGKLIKHQRERSAKAWLGVALFLLVLFAVYPSLVSWFT